MTLPPDDSLRPPRATPQDLINEIEPPITPGGNENMGTRVKLGGGVIQTVIVSLVVAIVVFVGMGMVGFGNFVTKKDFTTNLQGVVTTLDKAKSDITNMQKAVDTAITGISDKVNTQVNTAVSGQMGEVNNRINALSAKIDTAQSQIQTALANSTDALSKSNSLSGSLANINSSLEDILADFNSLKQTVSSFTTNMTALDTRLKVVETKLASGSGGTGGSSALPFTYTVAVINESDNTTTTDNISHKSSLSLKLTLTNTTDKALEDIGMFIPIEIDFSHGTIINKTMSLTGWTIQDNGAGYGYSVFSLKGHSIKLNANEKKKIYFDITLSFSEAFATGGNWSASVIDDDIEILDWDYK